MIDNTLIFQNGRWNWAERWVYVSMQIENEIFDLHGGWYVSC